MRLALFFTIFLNFIRGLWVHRTVIQAMALREIQKRYAGTLGGFLWSLVHPLMMILVYWFVFSVGFRVKPPGGFPFILVFLCGLIPWTLFNETLMASTRVIIDNPHLVKKVVFPTQILPLVNLTASLITHGIMLVILVLVMYFSGVDFSWYNLQFFYYLCALALFSIALSWLFAALNVFYRDVGHILAVLLNLWFWLTPIVWVTDMIPEPYRGYLQMNPMMYLVMGYKNSFLYHVPFWQDPGWSLYFWGLTLVLLVGGGAVFRRLKPEFAEVL